NGHASGTPATANASPTTCTANPKATIPTTTSGPPPHPNTPINNNSAAPLAPAHPTRPPRRPRARPRTATEPTPPTTRARSSQPQAGHGHDSPAHGRRGNRVRQMPVDPDPVPTAPLPRRPGRPPHPRGQGTHPPRGRG